MSHILYFQDESNFLIKICVSDFMTVILHGESHFGLLDFLHTVSTFIYLTVPTSSLSESVLP